MMLLADSDQQAIAARVTELERALGIEIVTVVTQKSDEYPEVVWKAFALGAAVTALVVAVLDVVRPDWVTSALVFSSVVAVLGVGALCATAAVYVPAFARRFLRKARAEVEVMQYAHDQFLARELFATPQRTALLIVVSLLEHRVVVLPDKGLRALASPQAWQGIVTTMTNRLRSGPTGPAVLAGLDAVDALLRGKTAGPAADNLFADVPHVGGRAR